MPRSKQTMNKTDIPGLYVHTPFCKTRCPYCDFYSTTSINQAGQWLETILKEARLYRNDFNRFDSLYIGGGTPSFLDNYLFEALFKGLRDILYLENNTEITVEMNPDDVTGEKLSLYRSLGVNRISLGVQSFNENEVRFLGRRHSAQRSKEALRLIEKAGFAELSIDLIYGLPRQTMRSWRQTLKKALSFHPSHMSCYQLTVEGNTHFSHMIDSGDLRLPREGRQADLFLATSETLSEAGFAHYEVSNFARSEQYLSRHNVKYWSHVPYLGLGPSSHSFLSDTRWWNVSNVKKYAECLNRGEKAIEGSEALSGEQIRLERLLFGLRTRWGIDISEISDIKSLNNLNHLRSSCLVELHEKRIIPTIKGYLFADRLPVMISG